MEALKSCDYKLDALIKDNEKNSISSCSKFRGTHVLVILLYSHPHWYSFKDVPRNGANCEFSEISEEQRIMDMNKSLDRGNHEPEES